MACDEKIKEWSHTYLVKELKLTYQVNIPRIPQKIPISDQCFQHVDLDLIGPLPPCQNYRYCLIMIDRFSRWPEAIPLVKTSVETISTTFYTH